MHASARTIIAVVSALFVTTPLLAQGAQDRTTKLVERFDADGDGRLDRAERDEARVYIKAERERQREEGGRRGPRRGGGDGPQPAEGIDVAIEDAQTYPGASFYDTSILRTVFLEFEHDDWDAEMADFYRTDVEVPARMIVDGEVIEEVGVAYRGNSSFFTVSPGFKRSFNVSVNAFDRDARIDGYRTLNFLNVHADVSYLREILFNYVAGHTYPAPLANHVRVVVNGKSWGIYVNAQQGNDDYVREAFGFQPLARWKIPANMRGGGGMTFNGTERSDYLEGYQLKSGDPDVAWDELIRVCTMLDSTPIAEIEALDSILDLDGTLRYLALENVLIDCDSYVSRGSDYAICIDEPHGRFHILPHDSNESFRYPGGGPGFNGVDGSGATLDPLQYHDEPTRPLIHKLVSHPALRARYLAHVRHLATEWLDWDRLEPTVTALRELIDEEVQIDTRKLYDYERFATSIDASGEGRRATPGIKTFVEERRAFLLAHPDVAAPAPTIERITLGLRSSRAFRPGSDDEVGVTALVSGDVDPDGVYVYYATAHRAPFARVRAVAGDDGTFTGWIPAQPTGAIVWYYVEARAPELTATSFSPPTAEFGAPWYSVGSSSEGGIVINEIMASNDTTIADPQGDFDDWIELRNSSVGPIDLAGMMLSDDADRPDRFVFPANTVLDPGACLIVWADRDEDEVPGHHAAFRLARSGGVVQLRSADGALLDELVYYDLGVDVALGRTADGSLGVMTPTPGASNPE